jgi:putative ABC transport system permease protein
VTLLMSGALGAELSARDVGLVAVYSVGMMLVCMLACIVPARRALRVEPTEALRAEG